MKTVSASISRTGGQPTCATSRNAVFMPTAAMATPMTYEIDGLQYVVVAAGGHQFLYPEKPGDWMMAFRLPEDEAAAATNNR